ncbi:MAG: alpha/beta hydrolase [Nitrospirae bacterium]|nr:alpha/beta hydrolase [Nitrospirota bacterium]
MFVHGAWHAAWCWAENFFPYFASRGFTCYAPNLRGHGDGGDHSLLRRARFHDFVQDLGRLIEWLETPPILVGHSMGGMVALSCSRLFQIQGLVFLASATPRDAVVSPLRFFMQSPGAILESLRTRRLDAVAASPEQTRKWLFSPDLPTPLLLDYHRRMQGESFRAFVDLVGEAFRPVAAPDVPTLVVGGRSDQMYRPWQTHATARRLRAECAILPGLAHNAMLDTRWRAAADRIAQWLERFERPDAADSARRPLQ